MKKNANNPTTKPAATAAAPPGGKSRTQGLVLSIDHRDQAFEYWPRPSELELAHLAARLVRPEAFDPKQLVQEAWSLYWESCRKIQADHREVGKMLAEEPEGDPWLSEAQGLPMPAQYPITFHEMERLLLPALKGRTAERAKVLREFVFAELVNGAIGIVNGQLRAVSYWEFGSDEWDTLREKYRDYVAARFGQYRQREYDQQGYALFAGRFWKWHRQWTERRNREAKAANARKGWAKRRKAKTAKTGARPKVGLLKEILEKPPSGA